MTDPSTDSYTDPTEEFASDYIDERKARIDKRNTWEKALREQQYRKLSSKPAELTDMYARDPLSHLRIGVQDLLGKNENVVRSELTQAMEAADANSRGEFGLDFWMQFDPDDLRLLSASDQADVIETRQAWLANATNHQAELDAKVELKMQGAARGRTWSQRWATFATGGFLASSYGVEPEEPEPLDREAVRAQVELEMSGDLGAIYKEQVNDWVEQYREMLTARYEGVRELQENTFFEDDPSDTVTPIMTDEEMKEQIDKMVEGRKFGLLQELERSPDPAKIFGSGNAAEHMLGDAFGVLGWTVDQGVRGLTTVLHVADAVWPGDGNYERMRQDSVDQRDAVLAAHDARWAEPDPNIGRGIVEGAIREAWATFPTDHPDKFNEYLETAGFDPMMAFAFFAADMEEGPLADQMVEYTAKLNEFEQGYVDDLKESDYRVSDQLLDDLARYGHNVPMWLATAFTVMLTDEDLYSVDSVNAMVDFFKAIPDEVKRYNNQPSAAVGLDGSLAGLMLDLTGGIMFDPVVWFFGVRGSSRGVKPMTPADVSALVKSPWVTTMVDDAIKFSADSTKGASSIIHLMDGMPDMYFGEFLHLAREANPNRAAILGVAERAIMNGGWVPSGASSTFVSRAMNTSIREFFKTSKPTHKIAQYMTQHNIITRIELIGTDAMRRIYDMSMRIWGDDAGNLNMWTERMMEYHRKSVVRNREAAARAEVLSKVEAELKGLADMTGGGWDDALRARQQLADSGALSEKGMAVNAQAQANRVQVQTAKVKLQRNHERLFAESEEAALKIPNTNDLAQILTDMWNDYNSKYIRGGAAWKKQAKKHPEIVEKVKIGKNEVEIIKWDELQKGSKKSIERGKIEGERYFAAETMETEAGLVGGETSKIMELLSGPANTKISVNVPLSPLELMMARETGGATWIRWTHKLATANAREAAFTINRLWMMDKVFKVSTAMTVSFDELLRIWHIGGPQAVARWQQDRVLFLKARSMAVLKGPGGKGFKFKGIKKQLHEGVPKGAEYLSKKSQARIQTLQEYGTRLKQAERQFMEGQGLGWTDINPDNPFYVEAARRWTGNVLQDSGFRAYLRGPEAFKEWFLSPDGQRLRSAAVLSNTGPGGSIVSKVMKGSEDAYKGWETVFERLILNKAGKEGKLADVRQAWVATAKRIDDAGGLMAELPDFVFNHLGPVRGIQRTMGNKMAPTRLTEKFFDNLFMNPVNYRRGFLAEMTRQSEKARLEALFHAQGKTIMSDLEIERALNMHGFGGSTRTGMKTAFQQLAEKQGYVSQSMIDDMVEMAVQKELDNVLFTWDRGSRMGQQSKAIFPFGRPWADMVGFWGREMMRKPVLRGWVNESNFLGLKSLNTRGLIPGNPKPAAMMSRLAATDFNIDKGLWSHGQTGGLLPGSDSTDIGGIFFLPTGGENVFASLIPGLGPLPIWAFDWAVERLYDPVNQPEEYQAMIDSIADFIPSMGYQQGGWISRSIGGGTLHASIGAGVDILNLIDPSNHAATWYGLTSNMGDITREINRSRYASVVLADPEELAELFATNKLDDPEAIELMIMTVAEEADRRASGGDLLQTVARWFVPANNVISPIQDVLDVWIDAADMFPELQVRPELREVDLDNDDNARRYANDVRGAFFELPSWKKDLMVAQNPAMAVNLVGTWEWTNDAVNAGIAGSDVSYKTGGSPAELRRHQILVDKNYVRPLQPIERIRRIVGVMFAAQDNAAEAIYTFAAQQVNDHLWDNVVKSSTKEFLESIAQSPFGERWDIRDARELWSQWDSAEAEIEKWIALDRGIGLDTAEYERLKEGVSVASKQQAWGSSWRGLDPEAISERFRNVSFNNLPSEAVELAKGLGITLTSGMNGEQLMNGLREYITNVEGPLESTVKFSYDTMMNNSSQASNTAGAILSSLSTNPALAPEWRQSMTEFLSYSKSIIDRYRGKIGGIPESEQAEVARRYGFLEEYSGPEATIHWEKVWELRYGRAFGPRDWVHPEPLSPYNEDGSVRSAATQPYIKTLTDGDSLVVQNNPGERSYRVRLLGVRAPDFGSENEAAQAAKDRLLDALSEAYENGDRIYLVRDPDTFGSNTDHYGRMLAWLWIGDTPYYFPDDFRRQQTPSGGE